MRTITFICLSFLLLTHCGKETMQYDINTTTPIVESYLEEGKTSLSVKLYSMEVYSQDEYLLSEPVTGLSLRVNGAELDETENGTYTLNLGENTIQGSQSYNLHFEYQGKTIRASTVVPSPVTGLTVDPTSMDQAAAYAYGTADTIQIKLSWDDPDLSFYQIYIETPASSTTVSPTDRRPTRRMMQPFKGNSYVLNTREFFSLGNYYIYVYRVNKDYVELYERISSTDLANPVSFIDNAFGIFTSMSVARVRFYVYVAGE